MLIKNPNNPKQAHVFLNYMDAHFDGNDNRHAQVIMKELAEKQDFRVLASVPQTLFDGWEFWIEFENEPTLPSFIKSIHWEPLA